MDLFARLDAIRDRWNVLDHPFYERWSNGDLTREDLGRYAGEYRHAVVALAEAARSAATRAHSDIAPGLELHADEEAGHIELWDSFGAAVGARPGAPGPETLACVEAWTAGADLLEDLVTLYSIESAQPAISRVKLEGLVEHYGMAADSPATAYFALHAVLDRDHAAHSRALIEDRLDEADADRLVEVAEAALRGNWTLLDGVDRRSPV